MEVEGGTHPPALGVGEARLVAGLQCFALDFRERIAHAIGDLDARLALAGVGVVAALGDGADGDDGVGHVLFLQVSPASGMPLGMG